ncbi:SufD family Fe-S cluster assembly protein [Microbacterium sp.]|uniref:SufD family Fe-S cluster assembly protein n=1 Tax=Microbacterium sp. TaxID=51671 RepID=UPI003C70D373
MTNDTADDVSTTTDEDEVLREVGYLPEPERAGTALIVDQEISRIEVNDPAVEILPLTEALERYDWVQDLMFSLVAPDLDEIITELAGSVHPPLGSFVRVRKDASVTLPVQTFTLLETPQANQYVHNICVIEEGATVESISGSAVAGPAHSGTHVSVCETFLGDGARHRGLSVEHWDSGMRVHCYSGTKLGVGAHAVSDSVSLSPVREHYSVSTCVAGADATMTSHSVVAAGPGTRRVIVENIDLAGDRSRAESVTRMVARGGTIENRPTLVGTGAFATGFVGCDGLKLSDDGLVFTSPALKALSASAQLSHEASVGALDTERVAYLMSTGLDEDTARGLIIQGFLTLDELALPASLRAQVDATVAEATSGTM